MIFASQTELLSKSLREWTLTPSGSTVGVLDAECANPAGWWYVAKVQLLVSRIPLYVRGQVKVQRAAPFREV